MNITGPLQPQDTSGTGASGTGLPSSQGLNNMFLQLLVAQLQNQSPLDPMDPTQFVGQLAQFSELSEVTQIEQTLQQVVSASSSAKTSGTISSNENSRANSHSSLAGLSDSQISLAGAAAQAAVPNAATTESILNRNTQGVF